MRIVGGKYKRRLINYPSDYEKNYETRPTKDRVREAIFSALNNYTEDSYVLDLFAGSGALGIEALSRNAIYCDFVDVRKDAFSIINNNLKSLGIVNAKVYMLDYKKALDVLKVNKRKYSLVLLDPPYKMDVYQEVIDYLVNNDMLTEDAIVVLESDHQLDVKIESKEIRYYKYGFIHVSIIKR